MKIRTITYNIKK